MKTSNEKPPENKSLNFAIIPQHPDSRGEDIQYILINPSPKDELKESMAYWMKVEDCPKEEVQIIQCFIHPLDIETMLKDSGTYKRKETIDQILRINEECKPKVHSLSQYAAKALAKNPTFFKTALASEKAEEQVKEEIKKLGEANKP